MSINGLLIEMPEEGTYNRVELEEGGGEPGECALTVAFYMIDAKDNKTLVKKLDEDDTKELLTETPWAMMLVRSMLARQHHNYDAVTDERELFRSILDTAMYELIPNLRKNPAYGTKAERVKRLKKEWTDANADCGTGRI